MTGKATKKTASVDTKVEAVRRFFADSKSANHPITDHPVSKQEEYVRDLYLEMLCVMAQYESSNTENAFTLIKRIMAACKETQPLEEYIKRSMELTPERAAEFVRQCKDNGLGEIFMVDSMLLSCANGEPNAKQVAFITEFGDMLGFDREQMKDMSSFTLAILAQDSEGYQKLLRDENAIVQESLVGYAKEFVIGIIVHSNLKMYYYSPKLQSFTWSKDESTSFNNLDEVRFENLSISRNSISFQSVKSLEIIGCTFHKSTLILRAIDKTVIDKCDFNWIGHESDTYDGSDYKKYYFHRAIRTYLSNAKVTITRTKFDGFRLHGYRDKYDHSYGAVYYDDYENGNSTIVFDHCEFSNIHNTRSNDSVNYAIFAYKGGKHSVTVTNCHFSNCDHTNHGRRLFKCIAHEENNTRVNSDAIY